MHIDCILCTKTLHQLTINLHSGFHWFASRFFLGENDRWVQICMDVGSIEIRVLSFYTKTLLRMAQTFCSRKSPNWYFNYCFQSQGMYLSNCCVNSGYFCNEKLRCKYFQLRMIAGVFFRLKTPWYPLKWPEKNELFPTVEGINVD